MGKPWFGPKTYGIGIGPRSRAGWLAVAVYLLLMIATPIAELSLGLPVWMVPAAFGLFTVVFLTLVVLNSGGAKSDGEPWRWRWGGR